MPHKQRTVSHQKPPESVHEESFFAWIYRMYLKKKTAKELEEIAATAGSREKAMLAIKMLTERNCVVRLKWLAKLLTNEERAVAATKGVHAAKKIPMERRRWLLEEIMMRAESKKARETAEKLLNEYYSVPKSPKTDVVKTKTKLEDEKKPRTEYPVPKSQKIEEGENPKTKLEDEKKPRTEYPAPKSSMEIEKPKTEYPVSKSQKTEGEKKPKTEYPVSKSPKTDVEKPRTEYPVSKPSMEIEKARMIIVTERKGEWEWRKEPPGDDMVSWGKWQPDLGSGPIIFRLGKDDADELMAAARKCYEISEKIKKLEGGSSESVHAAIKLAVLQEAEQDELDRLREEAKQEELVMLRKAEQEAKETLEWVAGKVAKAILYALDGHRFEEVVEGQKVETVLTVPDLRPISNIIADMRSSESRLDEFRVKDRLIVLCYPEDAPLGTLPYVRLDIDFLEIDEDGEGPYIGVRVQFNRIGEKTPGVSYYI